MVKEKKNYSEAQIAEVREKVIAMSKADWLPVKAAILANEEYKFHQTTINLALLLVILGFEDLENVHADTAHALFDIRQQSILFGIATNQWNWVNDMLEEL